MTKEELVVENTSLKAQLQRQTDRIAELEALLLEQGGGDEDAADNGGNSPDAAPALDEAAAAKKAKEAAKKRAKAKRQKARTPEELARAMAARPRRLNEISHDELGVIFDGLADPLQPDVAVALSSTCKGLWTLFRAGLGVLAQQHKEVDALCRKLGSTCALVRESENCYWGAKKLNADDMATMAKILCWLPNLTGDIIVFNNGIGDRGMQNLCPGLTPAMTPGLSLKRLSLGKDTFGPVGCEALAAAFRGGALPNLELLTLGYNENISDGGVKALAGPIRRLPRLREIHLARCDIGDEGAAALFAGLGKDDFVGLRTLSLDGNKLTDTIFKTLISTLNGDALPVIGFIDLRFNGLEDEEAAAAVVETRDPLHQGTLKVPIIFVFDESQVGDTWPALDDSSDEDLDSDEESDVGLAAPEAD